MVNSGCNSPKKTDRAVGVHIDAAFEALAANGHVLHDIRVMAKSEWVVLEALGRLLKGGDSVLRKLKVSRCENRPVCVAFQCAGLGSKQARGLVDALGNHAGIETVFIEYVLVSHLVA